MCCVGIANSLPESQLFFVFLRSHLLSVFTVAASNADTGVAAVAPS
jgi:hypothetical protein